MASRFITKVNEDKSLQTTLSTLPGNFDSLRTIADQIGCHFTIDEWLAARVVVARDFTAVFLNNSNTPSLKVATQKPDTISVEVVSLPFL